MIVQSLDFQLLTPFSAYDKYEDESLPVMIIVQPRVTMTRCQENSKTPSIDT